MDARANGTRLNRAIAASLAVHVLLLVSFATRAGLPGGTSMADSPPAQPLSVSLQSSSPRSGLSEMAPRAQAEPATAAAGGGMSGGAQPLSPIVADYPDGALALGVSAKVEVRALVDATGRVEEARIVAATLADVFDHSALAAVRATRFVPAMEAGKPVKSTYRAVIFYDLK